MTNRYEGYITREGRFIDVSPYDPFPGVSNHDKYCSQHNTDEDTLLNEYQWVKLSLVIPETFIFHGYELSVEQCRTLEEMGYDPESY